MALWKWLGLGGGGDAPEFDSLQEIERALVSQPVPRRRYVACFAYILTRSARADHDVTEAETKAMQEILSENTGIPPAAAAEVVALARVQARRSGGTDDFVITREFDRVATHEQKAALVHALFAVSAVDASIVTVEDNEIRRIANELKIEHAEYIGIRARHLEHLQVLRGSTPEP